jgi:hypothetical protein
MATWSIKRNILKKKTAESEKRFLFGAIASPVSETAKSDKTTFKEEILREKEREGPKLRSVHNDHHFLEHY